MLRVALTPAKLDDGICLAEAARVLGCDQSTVRELIRIGEVEGWKVGKHRKKENGEITPPTAIRVSLSSCLDYRARNSCAEPEAAKERKPRRRDRPSAAHLEALAELRRRGIRV